MNKTLVVLVATVLVALICSTLPVSSSGGTKCNKYADLNLDNCDMTRAGNCCPNPADPT